MCQVIFSLSHEHKHREHHAEGAGRVRARAHLLLFQCGAHERERVCGTSVAAVVFLQRRRVARERTGVIGSSLSPQTGGTFHHRGISFQFSKPRRTSDAINKVFFPNTGSKKKIASQQLFNHPL